MADQLDVLALIWCLLMLALIGFLWVCVRIPQRRCRFPTTPAPHNCRVIRGDDWVVGRAHYRFGDQDEPYSC